MRKLNQAWMIPVYVVALVAGAIHFHSAGFGSPEPRTYRGLHLALLLPMVFWLFPARRKSPRHRPSVPDMLMALFCAVAAAFTVYHADRLNTRFMGVAEVWPVEVFLGAGLAVLVYRRWGRDVSESV